MSAPNDNGGASECPGGPPKGSDAEGSEDAAGELQLLALPPEMRNRIYEYVLTSDDKIDINPKSLRDVIALLHTSKQIREEASGIFYGMNRFHARITISEYEFLTSGLELVKPRHAKLIEVVELTPEPSATENQLVEKMNVLRDDLQQGRIAHQHFNEEMTKIAEPIGRCRRTQQEVVVDLARAVVRAGLRAEQISVPLASEQEDIKVLYDGLLVAIRAFQKGEEGEDLILDQDDFDRRLHAELAKRSTQK